MEHLLLYSIGEIDKVILQGLKRYGQSKTFAQILNEAGFFLDTIGQVELAINLEALELIQTVSYNVPIEIRAELSPTGAAIVHVEREVTTHTPLRISITMQKRPTGFTHFGMN